MRWIGDVLRWIVAMVAAGAAADENCANNESVQLLQRYVQLNTTTGNDLSGAVAFWTELAAAAGVQITKYEYTQGYPVLVLKWPGTNSSLPSIMLNSHMDVVPANEDDGWTYPPFSGYLDDDGVIWGRGTQDMKSIAIQYYQALKNLTAFGHTRLRDVYMTCMPDEEIGGEKGIQQFLASDEFKAMNVGFELDEGAPFELPVVPVFSQDKVVWQIQVDCYGEAAHSSTFPAINDTAIGKCINVMNRFRQFREEEYQKYKTQGGVMNAGNYTSLNMNIVQGGYTNNVIPGLVTLVTDLRLNTATEETAFDAKLRQFVAEAGDNITMTYILKNKQSPATMITDGNPYWVKFKSVAQNLGIQLVPLVAPGSTDARFVRGAGYPSLGFSPMPNTELLLHSVDERLSAATFLTGIRYFQAIIDGVANIPGNETSADPSVYVVKTAV